MFLLVPFTRTWILLAAESIIKFGCMGPDGGTTATLIKSFKGMAVDPFHAESMYISKLN